MFTLNVFKEEYHHMLFTTHIYLIKKNNIKAAYVLTIKWEFKKLKFPRFFNNSWQNKLI